MRLFGASRDRLESLSAARVREMTDGFAPKKRYRPDDYARLLDPYLAQGFEEMTLLDFTRLEDLGDRRVLLIRHDVDHDHLTALCIAGWEASRGLRATYCLLHSAWYYGRLAGKRLVRTRDVLRTAQRLVELGHEVNFHNNLVVWALEHRIDPEAMLREELEFFRSNGVPILGSSTHGDALCRKLGFRNWELFRECCDGRFGGPRALHHAGARGPASIELGRLSMADFGLEYEAYDIHRDVYHTDSGGELRERRDTPGRRPFGRKDPARGRVVGVLTHPLWWSFPEVE